MPRIPKQIFDIADKITTEAFSFLVRLYAFIHEEGYKLNIQTQYNVLKSQTLLEEHDFDAILNELVRIEILTYSKSPISDFQYSYKICLNIKPRIRLEVVRRVKQAEDIMLAGYIESIANRFSPILRKKITFLLMGVVDYQMKCEKKYISKDLHKLAMVFMTAPEGIVSQTCDAYNASHRGRKGIEYIIGILKRIKADVLVRTEREDIGKYRQEREKATQKLAERLADGSAVNDAYYKSLLSREKYANLNKLYKTGVESLKKQGQTSFKTDYEWLR